MGPQRIHQRDGIPLRTDKRRIFYHFGHQRDALSGTGYPQIEGLNNTKRTKLSKSNLKYAHCLCINSKYIYYESNRYKGITSESENTENLIYDANATLAHELGHYLGLHHVFAEKDNKPIESYADTDYCTDTKSYNRPPTTRGFPNI